MCSTQGILLLAGLILVFHVVSRIAIWIYGTYFKRLNLKKYMSQTSGSWALITGSTDGIGLAFAQELAKNGFNLILISRSQEKLASVARSIKTKFSVEIECVANDARECRIDSIINAVKGKELRILVNNVGIWMGDTMCLHEVSESLVRDVVNINDLFPALLTHGVLPNMLESVARGGNRALIINVASMAAHLRLPFYSLYTASKAFNRNFSMSLSAEYTGRGIDVLVVNPGYVTTSMIEGGKPKIISCSPLECVDACLRRADEVDILPHYKHIYMQAFQVMDFLVPSMFRPKVLGWVYTAYYFLEAKFKVFV